MFMSSLSSTRRRSMIETLSLDALTPKTYTDPDNLSREITTIRKEGFSLDKEEFNLGMIAIAVPVSDADGWFYAALGVHGPLSGSLESACASFAGLYEAATHITAILFEE